MKIDSACWPTLSTLLDRYLDQAESARSSWLENLGPEYADVLPALRELLRSAEAAGEGFLETLPRVAIPDVAPGYTPISPGSVVGPYRLIRELGHGGMSVVWLLAGCGFHAGQIPRDLLQQAVT